MRIWLIGSWMCMCILECMCPLFLGVRGVGLGWLWLEVNGILRRPSIPIGQGRLRKPLEKLRPPSATESLLADHDGKILEGTVTNFFVVCFKGNGKVKENRAKDDGNLHLYELQTAPVHDGVLPGVIRQLVIEICLSKGISVREVSLSWSDSLRWEEAFITSSLRLVQHVEMIQAPSSWTSMGSKSWSEIAWVEKHFEGQPGMITTIIQREIMKRTALEGYLPALLG